MKNIFVLTAIFALVLSACDNDGTEKNNETKKETTLTISNNSNREIKSFAWNGKTSDGKIKVGDTNTISIEPGTGYIYINVYRGAKPSFPYWYRNLRTNEIFTIDEGNKRTFILLTSTIIIDVPTNKTYTFGEWASDPPDDQDWIYGAN